jgi:predicted Ser/Thr protein kinase
MPHVVGLLPSDPARIAAYRVLGRLGAGGQGVVYLGEAPDGRRVAIKQLHTGLPELADSQARRQLNKEVAAAQRVAPFCTAAVLEADVTGSSPYIVSEYIEGPSLQQHVRSAGPLTGSALQWMAIGTVTALAAIHQAGVVHRDFKPANVMLATDGPRVIDFGIARDLSTDVTVTSRIMGTPAYMAPEQVRNEPVGPAADLFAWASVIAYAATGKAPFEAGHMLAVAHRITAEQPDLAGVPEALAPVLRRCLAKDPARRPTAQQVLGMLLGRPGSDARADDLTEGRADDGAGDPNRMLAQAAGLVQRASAPESPAARPTLTGPPPAPRDPGDDRSYVGRTVAVAAGVVLLGLAVWGWGQADDRRAAHAATPRPSPTVSVAPTTVATAAAPTTSGGGASSPVVPEALDGDWRGSGYQPVGDVSRWTARVELDAGDADGKLELEELGCRGDLTVTSATDQAVTMDAVMTDNEQGRCAPRGTLQLSALGFGRATFFWRDRASAVNVATGVLTRE